MVWYQVAGYLPIYLFSSYLAIYLPIYLQGNLLQYYIQGYLEWVYVGGPQLQLPLQMVGYSICRTDKNNYNEQK